MHILLVEDEDLIASFVTRGLEAHGFVVSRSVDGEQALHDIRAQDPDLVLLDLGLPKVSGEQVLAALRRHRTDLPVIVLTAKDAVADRVAGLNAGADDYVVKPFSFSELLARVHARLRPVGSEASVQLAHGRVTLDLRLREAQIGDRSVDLTSKEFSLLETFMRHAGQVLSQAQLVDQVWGWSDDAGSNVVEVYVGYLRRKLAPDVIETVRGAGYRFRG